MRQPNATSASYSRSSLLGGLCLLLLGACSSESASPAEVQLKLELQRADDCSGLLQRVRDGLVAATTERADEFRQGRGKIAGVASSEPVSRNLELPPPGIDVPGSPGGGFSSNPVQIDGVDVPNIVKTDGDQVYVLQGGALLVLRGWPADDTAILGSVSIEGQPLEMLVRDGTAVVFSSVNAGFGAGAAPNGADDGAAYTKLTVVDVSGTTPAVLRESYLEGEYVSSRREGGLVRAVIHYDFRAPDLEPDLEATDASGQILAQGKFDAEVVRWRDATIQSLRNAQLADLLPRELSRQENQLVPEAPRCSDYYAADAGFTTAELTSVVSIDLEDIHSAFAGATILGNTARVYANASAMLVTQSDSSDPGKVEQTFIHRFDISGSSTSYVASGAVPGTIFGPLGLDEKDGVIRVATRHSADSVERVMTLETQSDRLVPLGALQADGAAATEFIGDRGYFPADTGDFSIVDLTDPSNPNLAGTLSIPGSSGYLMPLDAEHLLAFGGTDSPYQQVQYPALMIFDLSDPNPSWTQRYVFTDPQTVLGTIDRRGIKFDSSGSVLALPYTNEISGESTLEVLSVSAQDGFRHLGAIGHPGDYLTCLANQGLSPSDIVEVESDQSVRAAYESVCPSPETFTHGLFRDGFVYAVSNENVYAYSLSSMDAGPVQRASLPVPTSH